MSYNLYYNEIDTEALISSPQWTEAFSFNETFNHYPTESELIESGVYVEQNALIKNFTMSINGNPCNVKFRMTVEPIPGTGDYKVFTRGVSINSTFNDFIEDALMGFGYRGDSYTREDISLKILDDYEGVDIDPEAKIIKGIINIYGQSAYDYNILDIIWNYLEAYPDIDNPCILSQRPLPEGENVINVYDHKNFFNNVVAYNNDSAVASAFTPVQLKNALDNLADSDTTVKNILMVISYKGVQ